MKAIAALLTLALPAFASSAAFGAAQVRSVAGSAEVQRGTASPRPLRIGDPLRAGDTVITGPASSIVIKYDDGQVTALAAGSRMAVTTYAYDASSRRGNVLITLQEGGMRMIAGLIGRDAAGTVAVRAANAMIRVRDADFSVAVAGGFVHSMVHAGALGVELGGQAVAVEAGRAALVNPGGIVSQGPITPAFAQLQGTPAGPQVAALAGALSSLADAINRARPGMPTPGGPSHGGAGPWTETPTGPGSGGTGTPAAPS